MWAFKSVLFYNNEGKSENSAKLKNSRLLTFTVQLGVFLMLQNQKVGVAHPLHMTLVLDSVLQTVKYPTADIR